MDATERNKAVIRRYVDRVWGQRDLDAVAEFEAPDYWRRAALPRALHQPAHLRLVAEATFAAFPDYELEITELVAEDDRVAWRWTAGGTHAGSYNGVPPTGRRVVTTGIAVYRLRDGRIVERWGEADELGLLSALGAAPSVPAFVP